MIKICITFRMENDFETAEQCITVPVSKDFANRLKGWAVAREKAESDCISAGCLARDLCSTAAIMMGYSLIEIETVEGSV